MISVLKNNFARLMEEKSIFMVMFTLMIVATMAAVFLNSQSDIIANVAVSESVAMIEDDYPNLNIIRVDEEVVLSELVSGKYDAVVTMNGDTYQVETIKNEETKQLLESVLNKEDISSLDVQESRGTGTSIIGFLLMFIMLQSSQFMRLFASDKELGQLKRIVVSPISLWQYLCANCIFCFGFLYGSVMIIFSATKYLFGVDVGFNFGEYSIIFAVICALATAFSLCMNAFIKGSDSTNMISSALIVMTSILGGAFYSFNPNNEIFDMIVRKIPQNVILNISQAIENGGQIIESYSNVLYVIILIIGLFLIAIMKMRKEYVPKVS